ncbi:hypothetical protein PHYSODRAFT_473228 [Phytophthora sojae]|uniref:Uncharacterized protein n=1 Tax=Phytophthora sojae (strain P6497) TaxID=1094619 RepID=G4YG69_PHYSP|nr:hypothetical protein PHYSODRAFT_473228 [Phytophthora sojae]EGZ28681.1 hypothetical protein PHYSODRAFT_473228 [Phytophthora sojae]|eukprot:XP_009515956.1 hypothetical protein PHYSODRAFT_473228 [Phytophthora sojae]
MGQTSIYVDMNPKMTITFQGERDVDVVQGMSENSFRASVFLCASATGVKLPPFIEFAGVQGCKVEAEVHMNTFHKDEKVVLAVQKTAYCDERVMLEWIKEPSVTFCRVQRLDSLKARKVSTVRAQVEDAMKDEELVPPGATTLSACVS